MTYYLLEWTYEDYSDVEIFGDLEKLTGDLRVELASAHENDSVFDVVYMGIYEKGTLAPLVLLLTREVPEEDDFLDQHYEIRNASLETVATFIVRIDSRA